MAGTQTAEKEAPRAGRSFAVADLYSDLHNWIDDIADSACTPQDAAGNLLKVLALIESCDDETRHLVLEVAIYSTYRHTAHFRDSLRDYLETNCSNLLPGLGT
jgi:hypothetical protein